jgi:hypothetical protein
MRCKSRSSDAGPGKHEAGWRKEKSEPSGEGKKKTSQAGLAQEHDWFRPMANIEGRSP